MISVNDDTISYFYTIKSPIFSRFQTRYGDVS